MRIWQKIYFVVLLLFLILLNIGLFLAARFVFSYNLGQEKRKAESDCFFLCQNLERDFSILEQNGRYRRVVIDLLFEGYSRYYQTQNVELTLEETEETKEVQIRSDVAKGGGQICISAEQNLAEPYQNCRIHYKKRLIEFEEIWKSLKRTFAMISLSMSILLCLILYVLMRHSLKPLGNLNVRVAKIAAGEYGEHVTVKSRNKWQRDEIAELSQNVNKMSETIQRQIHALEEENEKKQQLMDNMAHELKTPLTSIYGYAEYIRFANAPIQEKYEGLDYIMEESRRLSKMSEIMLSMRLYEQENEPMEPVDIRALALHIEKILSPKLQEKNLTIQKNFDVSVIYGEEELFINLFRNLLENAVRASKEGDSIVWNVTGTKEKQKIELIDYGIGMEQEELDRITEAFYRVDKARSRQDGGVGLGLSVADLIVKKMGGSMSFSSEPQKGTKVTLIFTTS